MTHDSTTFRIRPNSVALIGLTTLLLLSLAPVAHADETISISPPIREVTAQPGEVIQGEVTVSNQSTSEQTYFPLVRDFRPNRDPTQAAPEFFEPTGLAPRDTLTAWVRFATPSVTIPAGGTGTLAYTLSVPLDGEPGGHFGAVFATTRPPTGQETIDIEARAGSLLLVTVTGAITVQGSLRDFSLSRRLAPALPLFVTYATSNTGNVHLTPRGTLAITARNGTVVASQPLNPVDGRVLPGSERTYHEALVGSIGYGRFTVTLLGELVAPSGPPLPVTATTTVWLLPYPTVALGILVLLCCWFGFRVWLRRHDARLLDR